MDVLDQTLNWQRDQYEHDMKYHFDILSLHRTDRLKHYALHFSKYAGRLARADAEVKSPVETFTDCLLVCFSTANALQQQLKNGPNNLSGTFLIRLTDAAGRVSDAAEKVDHLEPFIDIAKSGNQDVFATLMNFASVENLNVDLLISERRAALRSRQFFVR